ncbi:hypothetical protein NQ314_009466 [Rhamnusium bicolor]|uniref:Uncharacterized protein n=1 Tax=Rhamnusium bicolor TaxID=1586634 RepID=A0AAV8Y2S1_9CUCU|nr:hypothetical protein NQ314_009466 [Rhamnusium bicolor]
MSTIEENIPAFSMWKMFNDTVPVLMKGDCSETSVRRLASIIQSKEFSNIFIFSKDPLLTFQEYHKIEQKYKAFTTWLLGQFFYLLGHDRFSKIHDIIIDTQLCILDQLSKTQLHVYNELAGEYNKAFDLLVNYSKEPSNKLLLKVFIPEMFEDLNTKLDLSQVHMEVSSKKKCLLVIGKLIKFVKYILMENFLFYSFDDGTYKTLDSILYLLSVSDTQMKLDIIDIFINIFSKPKHDFKEYDLEITKKWLIFSSLFEQFIYNIYNLQVDLKNKALDHFENLLVSYLKMGRDFKSTDRINMFIFSKSLERRDFLPSKKCVIGRN